MTSSSAVRSRRSLLFQLYSSDPRSSIRDKSSSERSVSQDPFDGESECSGLVSDHQIDSAVGPQSIGPDRRCDNRQVVGPCLEDLDSGPHPHPQRNDGRVHVRQRRPEILDESHDLYSWLRSESELIAISPNDESPNLRKQPPEYRHHVPDEPPGSIRIWAVGHWTPERNRRGSGTVISTSGLAQ